MWHIKHSNGDEEDLWEDELTKAKGYYENDVKELQGDEAEEAISGWKKTGHAFIGKDVIRFHLTKRICQAYKAVISKYKPAESTDAPNNYLITVTIGGNTVQPGGIVELSEKDTIECMRINDFLGEKEKEGTKALEGHEYIG